MEAEDEFNATWITADSSEPLSDDLHADLPIDDSRQLFLDRKFFNVIDCEDKWKLPDSSVMNPTQEDTSQENIQIKKEAPDDYGLSVPVNPFAEVLDKNDVPSVMHSGDRFDQVRQKLHPAPLTQDQLISYSPKTDSITSPKSSSDSNFCDECGKTFSCNRSFRRHMAIHTGARPFPCQDCGRAFSRKDSLRAHERRHRRRTTHFRYHCQYCGINFLNSLQLHTHEQQHVSPGSSLNEVVTNIKLTNSQATTSNARAYVQPEPRPPTGNKIYDRMSSQSTVSVAPPVSIAIDKKIYKCTLCRRLFNSQYSLNCHIKTHTPLCYCDLCGKSFRFRRNKQIHIMKYHSKLQCMQCQRNFTSTDALRSHQMHHCTANNMVAPSFSGQNQTRSFDSAQPHHCECGIYFPNKNSLQKHKVLCHHGDSSMQNPRNPPGNLYTLADGNDVGALTAQAVSENVLTAGQQTIEVCPIQDTMLDNSESKLSNTVLKCNICKSRLKKPRTLPCTHSFCHACLDNCLDRCTSSLSCPTCELVLVLPEGGLASLQANQMISSLLSEVENSEQQLYPVCIVCEVNASHHCQQCDAFICIKCSNAHLKLPATKDHTQISLAEYHSKDPRERMAATVVMCKEHGSPSQFFCSSCQKLICVGCTLVDHPKGSGHDIIDLGSAFHSFCAATEPMMVKCEEQEKKLRSAIDEMKPLRQIGPQIRHMCRESIQTYIAKLRAVVDKLQENLLREVEDLTTVKQATIDSRLDSLTKELEDLSGTRLLATQLVSSPNNALALTITSDVSRHLKVLINKSAPASCTLANRSLQFIPSGDLVDVIQQKGIGSLEETFESELKDEVIMIE